MKHVTEFLNTRQQMLNYNEAAKKVHEQAQEERNKLDNDKYEAERRVREEYRLKFAELEQENNRRRAEVDQEFEQSEARHKELKEALNLNCIVHYLGEPLEKQYSDYRKPDAMVVLRQPSVLFDVVVYIIRNKKPTNKYDLAIALIYRHLKVEDHFTKALWDYKERYYSGERTIKSFPTEMDAMSYFNRHSEKLLKNIFAAEQALIKKAESVTLDPAKDFDCRLVNTNYSGQHIGETSRDYFIVQLSIGSAQNPRDYNMVNIRVDYQGNGEFVIQSPEQCSAEQQEKLQKEVNYIIKNSEPIFIDKPTLIIKEMA